MRDCDGLHECSSIAQQSLWSGEADPRSLLLRTAAVSLRGPTALSSEFSSSLFLLLLMSKVHLDIVKSEQDLAPTPQLSNLLHERDLHALTEKDKQDASTRVTWIKEIVF